MPAEHSGAPVAFHALAKPTGAACNLACKYCFYLPKAALYPGERLRMTDAVQEQYIRQTLAAHTTPEVTIAWQGGEPTLMGLDFYRRAVALEQQYGKPGVVVQNTIQTNGLLLDDEWCAFLHDNHFLVGVSIDGPRRCHDAYRADVAGNPTFDRVVAAIARLSRHQVDFNALTTVHAANGDCPVAVYRFLRDDLGVRFLQFIPIVEWAETTDAAGRPEVGERSVGAEQYGRFLCAVFDEWVQRDVGSVYVQAFDAALSAWCGLPASLCVFAETCGTAPALEHNGDLYACDHFVDRLHYLGNIGEQALAELVFSEPQTEFGRAKREGLPEQCLSCRVRFACNGGCPKDRYPGGPLEADGANYLCPGYRAFFEHVDAPMQAMARLLRQGRPAAEIMRELARAEAARQAAYARCGRNDACPCGSGRKFKHCHGAANPGRSTL
jgi:uncharacterized protein